jgi:disulfide bond formation protein DsbB
MGSNLRMQAAAGAVGSAATLGAALAFQHLGGLAPCELCYWQRYPYWGAIPLAILGTVLPGRAGALCLAGAAICLATTAGIGGFHVGVEQHWWQGTSACGSAQGPAASLEELRARLAGLSMAAYNMLIAAALGLTAGWTALKRWKGDVQ